MQPLEQVTTLAAALRRIQEIAVEEGADAMPALLEAQRIAHEGLKAAGLTKTLPFARMQDLG
jgi:hypothetical protein